MEPINNISQKPYKQALRLTFSYDKDTIKLIDQKPVRMMVAASHQLTKYEGQSGFWTLLKDKSGKALYRRVMQNPVQLEDEIFSNDPSEGIMRKPIAHPKGQFQIIIPDIPHADSLEFMTSPLEIGKHLHPAKTLTKFSMKTIRAQK